MKNPVDISQLVKTADQYGYLMPSFIQTAASDTAKASGMVEDVLTKDGVWPKLTAAGMYFKNAILMDAR